ncbi:MAG: hypothetical protein LZF60_140041 [Nitrospira sp.]|nr:MAG: hypothetical protein LZF60_140041 [Nitrospira sp.]
MKRIVATTQTSRTAFTLKPRTIRRWNEGLIDYVLEHRPEKPDHEPTIKELVTVAGPPSSEDRPWWWGRPV